MANPKKPTEQPTEKPKEKPGEKLKSAVALAYTRADSAPRVVAKGRGILAEEIISRAQTHGVYVHQSPELLALLMQIDLDERIPPQLYAAVSELLAWLYRLESGTPATPPDTEALLDQGLPETKI